MKKIKQKWMLIDPECVSDDAWEHYSSGGCICDAHGSYECCCGSWDLTEEERKQLR